MRCNQAVSEYLGIWQRDIMGQHLTVQRWLPVPLSALKYRLGLVVKVFYYQYGQHAVDLGQNLLRPSFHFPRQLPLAGCLLTVQACHTWLVARAW